jgi:hypothetical protein
VFASCYFTIDTVSVGVGVGLIDGNGEVEQVIVFGDP